MNNQSLAIFATALIFSMPIFARSQEGHMKGIDMHMKHPEKAAPKPALQPAEGAGVKIISPKSGQTFKGDEIPLQFKMTKGKRGSHVHAYVDGELMGMFQSEKGTLTGIKPGQHTLELRVVAEDHQTELNAVDKLRFIAK